MRGLMLNPNEQIVKFVKQQIRQCNGYCMFQQQHNKSTKCPKPCKKCGECACGMYVPYDQQGQQYNLD